MKHIIVISALAIFVLLPIACKKEQIEATTVTGQVRTFGTEDPIIHPSVRVQLLERISTAVWGSADYYEVVDETMTDENQNFTLKGDLDKSKRYYLGIDRETISSEHHYAQLKYRDYTNNNPEWQLQSIGGTVQQNFYMVARGWVHFHFLSENPQPGDQFSYNLGGGNYELFYGPVDVERIISAGGNMEHKISLELKRDGTWSNWQEYICVPAFDTIEVQIKF